MALPTSNITLSMVGNAIGSGSRDLGILRTSINNNFWGFAKAYSLDKDWGANPQPPYKLGDYRGYDHYWRCWAMQGIADNSTHYEDNTRFDVRILNFPDWSVPDGTNHVLKVEFKRSNDYQQGAGSLIETKTLNNEYSFPIFFNNVNPPDGGAALSAGQTVYIRVTHISSEIRRWDNRESLTPEFRTDEYVFPFVIKAKGWTNYTFLYTASISAFDVAGTKSVRARVQVKNDNPGDVTVSWQAEISTSASFDVNKTTLNSSYQATGQPIPTGGGVLSLDSNEVITNAYAVGTTLYYRTKITAVSSGTYSSAYISGTTVVGSQLPQD